MIDPRKRSGIHVTEHLDHDRYFHHARCVEGNSGTDHHRIAAIEIVEINAYDSSICLGDSRQELRSQLSGPIGPAGCGDEQRGGN